MSSFVSEFEWAVIRLATYQNKKQQSSRLLFATVTLLAPDRQRPITMENIDSYYLKKSKSAIHFHRTVMKAQEAVAWYRSLHPENSKTPNSYKDNESDKDFGGYDFIVSEFIDNPIWPNLGLPIGSSLFPSAHEESNPAPFIGTTPSRVHFRFGNDKGFEKILFDELALNFLERRLHVDLNNFSEYLGSVALVVPDPIVQKIDNFLIPKKENSGEKIFYRFVPRPGKKLDDLSMVCFDQEGNLLTRFETYKIPSDGKLTINKTIAMGVYGYALTHPLHGILAYQAPASFLRQMSLNVSIVGQQREIAVPETNSSTSSVNTFQVNRRSDDTPSVIGDEPTSNINLRVGTASRRREKAVAAKNYDQRWFSEGSRAEAMNYIRKRIGQAKSRVIIADPYFGVLQVPQFLPAISQNNVEIIVLTSRLAFEGRAQKNESDESSLPENIVNFEKMLIRVRDDLDVPNIVTKVLLGKKPILHDRFMIIDDDVWFLGNSLNMLGSKASLILKLPNPDEVIIEITRMLDQSRSFDVFKKEFSR